MGHLPLAWILATVVGVFLPESPTRSVWNFRWKATYEAHQSLIVGLDQTSQTVEVESNLGCSCPGWACPKYLWLALLPFASYPFAERQSSGTADLR